MDLKSSVQTVGFDGVKLRDSVQPMMRIFARQADPHDV